MEVLPYKEKDLGKKEQVALMFDNVSRRYDLLNRVLSLGIDISWRKKAIRLLKKENPKPQIILDIATGTGDFAIEAMKLNPKKIVGVDISEGMLNMGKKKIRKLNLEQTIQLQLGDSENLAFDDNYFDTAIVSFGVRNFENLQKGLKEIKRVLKNNGTLVVLEFSQPTAFPFKQFYNFYSNNLIPKIGKMVSKDSSAYTYLPDSVKVFPYGEDFLNELRKAGLKPKKCVPVTLGISSIYIAKK